MCVQCSGRDTSDHAHIFRTCFTSKHTSSNHILQRSRPRIQQHKGKPDDDARPLHLVKPPGLQPKHPLKGNLVSSTLFKQFGQLQAMQVPRHASCMLTMQLERKLRGTCTQGSWWHKLASSDTVPSWNISRHCGRDLLHAQRLVGFPNSSIYREYFSKRSGLEYFQTRTATWSTIKQRDLETTTTCSLPNHSDLE